MNRMIYDDGKMGGTRVVGEGYLFIKNDAGRHAVYVQSAHTLTLSTNLVSPGDVVQANSKRLTGYMIVHIVIKIPATVLLWDV